MLTVVENTYGIFRAWIAVIAGSVFDKSKITLASIRIAGVGNVPAFAKGIAVRQGAAVFAHTRIARTKFCTALSAGAGGITGYGIVGVVTAGAGAIDGAAAKFVIVPAFIVVLRTDGSRPIVTYTGAYVAAATVTVPAVELA